jgi:hypothetical protein
MFPFERDLYVDLLKDYMEKQQKEQANANY